MMMVSTNDDYYNSFSIDQGHKEINIYIHMCVCKSMYVYMYIYVCMYTCMHICIYIYVHNILYIMYTYIYTYSYNTVTEF